MQKLETLVQLRKNLLSANRGTIKGEGATGINGYSITKEETNLEVKSDTDLIYQRIKKYNLMSNAEYNIVINTKEEGAGEKVDEGRKRSGEYKDSLGILRDQMEEVLHVRTNHTVRIIKLMRFNTLNLNAATVKTSKAREKDVSIVESGAHKKNDLSLSGLEKERAEEAERKKTGKDVSFFSFFSRTARREVNSRDAACNAAVHLVVAIDTKSKWIYSF